jgi:hypothetical protein
MRSSTKSQMVHATTLTPDQKPVDGGLEFLMDVFSTIHEAKRSGELVVQFGPGGTIRSTVFREQQVLPQSAEIVMPQSSPRAQSEPVG